MAIPRQSTDERLNEILTKINSRVQLSSPTELTRDVELPLPIATAVMANRPELLRAVTLPNPTPEQSQALVNLCATLMETNVALQEHAQQLGHLVGSCYDQLTGTLRTMRRIESFANFQKPSTDDDAEG